MTTDDLVARWKEWGDRWHAVWTEHAEKEARTRPHESNLFHQWAANAKKQADAEIRRLTTGTSPAKRTQRRDQR